MSTHPYDQGLEENETCLPCLLPHRFLSRQEKQYRQFSRLLHDELGQSLAALRLRLALIEGCPELQNPVHLQHIRNSIQMVDIVTAGLRRLAHTLYPTILEATDLDQALLDCCRRANELPGKTVVFQGSSIEPLPGYVKMILYRLVEETFHCLALEKEALTIALDIAQDAEKIQLHIRVAGLADNENAVLAAFLEETSAFQDHFDRVALLGGMLAIETPAGPCIQIIARIPLDCPIE